MILAEKIVRLRKQVGWSQEELAEKLDVSRQSVSKWEATNSIPDLTKIIMLSEIFDVSTDYLLKDTIEISEPLSGNIEQNTLQIGLEQAMNYVGKKVGTARLTAKGVFLCVASVVPLFVFLALAETKPFNITSDIAGAAGVVAILVMISIGISFFVRTNQYESDLTSIENEPFELAYGVHSVFKEKLEKFRGTYNLRLSISISLFIFSFVPLMFVSMSGRGSDVELMMLIVLILMIATGIYLLIPVAAKYEAYNRILKEEQFATEKSMRVKRMGKLAAFYWPLLATIYLGWSFWTMAWGVTWIVWPVGGILFIAIIGLTELLDKEDS